MLLLGGIAMRLGRTLKWDPEKEEFPGAADANRLLSMAARTLAVLNDCRVEDCAASAGPPFLLHLRPTGKEPL